MKRSKRDDGDEDGDDDNGGKGDADAKGVDAHSIVENVAEKKEKKPSHHKKNEDRKPWPSSANKSHKK
jgi:hypothetical protein